MVIKMTDMNLLTKSIKKTMVSISYQNVMNKLNNFEVTVDHDIDVAFNTINNCFDVESIEDTVTRRMAKTMIFGQIEVCVRRYNDNKKFDIEQHLNDNIDVESIIEDIVMMQED